MSSREELLVQFDRERREEMIAQLTQQDYRETDESKSLFSKPIFVMALISILLLLLLGQLLII
jgi:hypothetical protein